MIKPCPFCASKNIHMVSASRAFHYVICRDCLACSGERATEEDAIAAWNTRPREEKLLGALKETQKSLDKCGIHDPAKKAEELIKKYEAENE